MAEQITFDPTEGPTQEQKDAEAQALAQGEKLEQAAAADREQQWDRTNKENENLDLIGGKFKNQEDLLKAYQELEKQRSQEAPEDTSEGDTEDESESTETDSEETTETNPVLSKAADEYQDSGQLSEESIDELSKMDSKDLIKAYVDFYTKTAQARDLQNDSVSEIHNIAGGKEEYAEMVQWAADNLDRSEADSFNTIANSGNVQAIKFAVEALNNRYKEAVGYEAPLVTGGKSGGDGVQPYRSQAELARDIADPKYASDPAFRQDIEERLAVSTDLF